MDITGKKQIRVMLVEDEIGYQDLVKLVLSLEPLFEVCETATTGEEALQKFEQATPDLVLVDFRLPGIDGLETTRRLKERRPDVVVVMVDGTYRRRHQKARAERRHQRGHSKSPFRPGTAPRHPRTGTTAKRMSREFHASPCATTNWGRILLTFD